MTTETMVPCRECKSMLPIIEPGAVLWWVRCRSCAATVHGSTREAAIEKWNKVNKALEARRHTMRVDASGRLSHDPECEKCKEEKRA